ncbi:hypothetical protein LSAT2_028438, partial [Lamellibrachia satsuma]
SVERLTTSTGGAERATAAFRESNFVSTTDITSHSQGHCSDFIVCHSY